MDNTILRPYEFLPILEEHFNNGLAVNLTVTGNSMVPFLCNKRDSVCLTQIQNEPKAGDIYLYKRVSGQLVLHRVKKVTSEGIWFIGDSQRNVEGPVPKSALAAECHTVIRKGKILSEKSALWRFFKYVWLNIIPFRHFICKIIAVFKKVK